MNGYFTWDEVATHHTRPFTQEGVLGVFCSNFGTWNTRTIFERNPNGSFTLAR